jgi:hypothetical protein
LPALVRYVVIVTSDVFLPRSDAVEGSVTYRFVNVAVDPSTPSRAARAPATRRGDFAREGRPQSRRSTHR